MATQIQMRRDTAANWASANPTLAAGEIGFETDQNKFKIGDGSTAYNSQPYAGGGQFYSANTVTGDGIAGVGSPVNLDADGYSTSVFTTSAGSTLGSISNLSDGQKHIVVVPTLAGGITDPGAAQSIDGGSNCKFATIETQGNASPYDGTYGGTGGDYYPNQNAVLVMEFVGYDGNAYCTSWSQTSL